MKDNIVVKRKQEYEIRLMETVSKSDILNALYTDWT